MEVHWRAFELRPKGAPPISDAYRLRIEAARPQLYQIARERYGLEMNPGPFGQDSRPALIAAKAAEAQGKGPEYHAHLMVAYWQQGRALDDLETLVDLAQAVGLEPAAFRRALADPENERLVDDDIHEAQISGLNSVPAIVFAGKYLVSGAQPLDVLRRVVAKVREEEASTGEDGEAA